MNTEIEKLIDALIQAAMNKAIYKAWDSRSVNAEKELAKAKAVLVARFDESEACFQLAVAETVNATRHEQALEAELVEFGTLRRKTMDKTIEQLIFDLCQICKGIGVEIEGDGTVCQESKDRKNEAISALLARFEARSDRILVLENTLAEERKFTADLRKDVRGLVKGMEAKITEKNKRIEALEAEIKTAHDELIIARDNGYVKNCDDIIWALGKHEV